MILFFLQNLDHKCSLGEHKSFQKYRNIFPNPIFWTVVYTHINMDK